MKKLFILVFCFMFISSLIFIGDSQNESLVFDNNELRAVFISYIELNKYVKDKNEETSKNNIKTMIENIDKFGFNTLILQIRSFSDAIYESDIFPWSSTISIEEGIDPGYDVLQYFIELCLEKNISVIGWINPYRVRSSSNSFISSTNPAYKYIGTDYLYDDEGIYFNPSKQEVEDLIVTGIEEVIKKYKLDGILFDDYFYPNTELDYLDYLAYLETNEYISFDNYHLMIINKLIKRVHDVCSKYNVLFGISPDGNISNNYDKVFADVKTWLSSSEYVDFIMPQVYYGFFNESKAFKTVIDEWNNLIKNDDIKLYIALAFYKVGLVDKYARSGSDEWILNDDIIMREIILARNLKYYEGFSLFRYDYLFDSTLYTDTTMLEIKNIKKILN